MKRFLITAGLVLFGLCFFGLWTGQTVKLKQSKQNTERLQHAYDSVRCIEPDTIKIPGDTVKLPPRFYALKAPDPVPVKDSSGQIQEPVEQEIVDSLTDDKLRLQYTISTTNGRFNWIGFEYQVTCPIIKMPAPEPKYIEIPGKCPERVKYSLFFLSTQMATPVGLDIEYNRWSFMAGYDLLNKGPAMGARFIIRK